MLKFIEIDCGPGGIVWELHSDDNEHLRTYESEAAMLNDAALLRMVDVDYRFYTQAEYNLEVQVEIMTENGVWNGQA
jgi:hypothetical protein